ncbi:MAG: CopD family protein [Lautropia sp.]|nr:CopD family protein [Lautropia sp.]
MSAHLYLWTKVLHIVMVVSWFAGLFYLPRIYVNLAQVDPEQSRAEYRRLLGMSQRLYRFMFPLATFTIATGLVLFLGAGIGLGPGNGWMHVKLTCVILLLGYHHGCGRLLKKFVSNRHPHSERWFRFFNEVPVILLLIIIMMVVLKPF